MTDLQREWEQRLAGEGLAHLDGRILSNKGAGKLDDDLAATARQEMERHLEICRDTLRTVRMTREQRAVWRLHAQGVGYQKIASDLGITQWAARTAIEDVAKKAGNRGNPGTTDKAIKSYVRKAHPSILMALLRAMVTL